MMQWWSDYPNALRDGVDVIPLHKNAGSSGLSVGKNQWLLKRRGLFSWSLMRV